MILIHLTRHQRRQLKELHPGSRPHYITKALRFIINSPLAVRIRRDALNLGGKIMTDVPTPIDTTPTTPSTPRAPGVSSASNRPTKV